MKIDLKCLEHIQFLNGFTEKDIAGSEQARIQLINSSLTILLNEKRAAKINGGPIGHEGYLSKLIIFSIPKHKVKEIILEVHCNEKESHDIAKMVKLRNELCNYKDPLKLDYSKVNRDSILSTNSEPTNLRGFFNLFIVFSFLIYWRLIIEHSFKYGSIFSKHVV